MKVADFRKRENDVSELFINRWSPRAMSGEAIDEATLRTLFEAARWAPSSNNNQPWRFIYARRNTPAWDLFFSLLAEGNRGWAKNAAVLVVVVSKTTFDSGKPARTHSYDTGAAWVSLALQGSLLDLVVHGMQGFDYERAKSELGVPGDHAVEAMIAIGRHGKKEDLPAYQQEREFPSPRKRLGEIAMEGKFSSGAPAPV
ncbi:MAG: nitroreductase family protein [Deltaproteobacteria bacterium]|jgi:nitroreductase